MTGRQRSFKKGISGGVSRTNRLQRLKRRGPGSGSRTPPSHLQLSSEQLAGLRLQYTPQIYEAGERVLALATSLKTTTDLVERCSMVRELFGITNLGPVAPLVELMRAPSLVEALLRFAQDPRNPYILRSNSLAVVMSVSSGEDVVYARRVVDAGAIPICVGLLKAGEPGHVASQLAAKAAGLAPTAPLICANDQINLGDSLEATREAGVGGSGSKSLCCLSTWILTNVAGDSEEFRDFILSSGGVAAVLAQTSPVLPVDPSVGVWFISNILRLPLDERKEGHDGLGKALWLEMGRLLLVPGIISSAVTQDICGTIAGYLGSVGTTKSVEEALEDLRGAGMDNFLLHSIAVTSSETLKYVTKAMVSWASCDTHMVAQLWNTESVPQRLFQLVRKRSKLVRGNICLLVEAMVHSADLAPSGEVVDNLIVQLISDIVFFGTSSSMFLRESSVAALLAISKWQRPEDADAVVCAEGMRHLTGLLTPGAVSSMAQHGVLRILLWVVGSSIVNEVKIDDNGLPFAVNDFLLFMDPLQHLLATPEETREEVYTLAAYLTDALTSLVADEASIDKAKTMLRAALDGGPGGELVERDLEDIGVGTMEDNEEEFDF